MSHAMRNPLTRIPGASQSMVVTLVRTLCERPDADQVWAQYVKAARSSRRAGYPLGGG